MTDNSDLQSEATMSKVGYKKPPKETRFPPGQSGNPSGRPRGPRSLRHALRKELNVKIPSEEGGRSRRITKYEAVAKRLVDDAGRGEPRSVELLMRFLGKEEEEETDDKGHFTLIIEGE